jgi:3-hydroxybutyryl-CoA dehydratase
LPAPALNQIGPALHTPADSNSANTALGPVDTASLISAVLGTLLPGPGAIYISQTLNFRAPVRIGDTVHVQVEVVELIPDRHRARLACTCRVGEEVVLDGEALIKVPSAANSPPLLSPGG